jgi:P-type Mg2+ transporter
MASFPSSVLPKNFIPAAKRDIGLAEFSPKLYKMASLPTDQALSELQSGPNGLSEEEAIHRIEVYGPNVVAAEHRFTQLRLLMRACLNPLVILLVVLAAISFATAEEVSDLVGGGLMVVMVVLGVSLRFIQESRADTAAAKLKAMIRVTATVMREGKRREIPLAELVPGDVVKLSAGDMIPADSRVLSCKDLFLIQASLTGESFPVEKFDQPEQSDKKSPLELKNICFLGTSVESGTATALVIETGLKTYLGTMASAITQEPPPTSFDRGVSAFTWLMLRFMGVMVPFSTAPSSSTASSMGVRALPGIPKLMSSHLTSAVKRCPWW